MSGLLALLDDVATIAKVAAASLDDVMGQATKAGVKAAGAVIDDAAVTPKYVQGFAPARELPIVGRIAMGSIRNKLVILLPAALFLSAFAPGVIPPLLMLGGAYLCFEGAEKLAHALFPPHDAHTPLDEAPRDAVSLEAEKVAGAIKTDFILSAEIMTIALASLPDRGVVFAAVALALVGIAITALVYGGVALIVKADDVGLHLATTGRTRVTRGLGRGIVRGMPGFMAALSVVGTAAMLWVGGSIVLHGAEEIGFGAAAHLIHGLAVGAAALVPGAAAAVEWAVTAALDGAFGVVLGFALIPVATRVIGPLGGWVSRLTWAGVSDALILLGRLLLAALFAGGAVQKVQAPEGVMGLLADLGLPPELVWPALAFNAVAALALVLGVWVRPVALALAAYCAVTSVFHYLPEDPWQMTIFVKNWAIAGGLLALAGAGAGRFALRP